MFTWNKRRLAGIVLPILLLGLAQTGLAADAGGTAPAASKKLSLTDRVRHELVTLPYNGVFDNLSFTIEGTDTVVLSGQVLRPVLKSEAEAAVRSVEGVSKVINRVETLPVSPFDDSIRLRAYRAIFFKPGFEKYAIQGVSPIRIIVKNGNITLEGVVGSRMDKTLAVMAAYSVPGAFSVTDNLKVQHV